MAIDQLVVAASPGDAVTNAVFRIRAALRSHGPSDIYARYIHEELAGEVRTLGELAGAGPLLFHASIGEPDVAEALRRHPGPLLLMYHNIAPAQYFDGFDPAFAARLRGGRAELADLRTRVCTALVYSVKSAKELEGWGYTNIVRTKFPLDLERLRAHPAAGLPEALAGDGPLVLCVAQLLPHKRIDLLLQAFYVLHRWLCPTARLAVVGPAPSERYRSACAEFIDRLGMPAVITGRLNDRELAACYREAGCFVTMSEHEGFGVPLLEAMATNTPVVARSWPAIPETAGGAALLLPIRDDPSLVAEAIFRVVNDRELSAELIRRGRERINREQLDPELPVLMNALRRWL